MIKPRVQTDRDGGRMAIPNTFTTVEPMGVCYPRLNSTLPLDGVKVDNPRPALDGQSLDLVNKVEGLGLRSTVGFLLVE